MGNFQHWLLVLLQGFLFLVSAVSIPLESAQDVSSLSLTLPADPVTNLTAPDPPPGFRVTVDYLEGPEARLTPSTFYINAIHAMWLLITRTDWDSTVTEEQVIRPPDINVVMVFQAEPDCKLSYWILGLYQAVIEMTNSGTYKAAMVQLFIQQIKVGTIRITNPTSIDDVSYTNSSDTGGGTPTDSALTDDGRVYANSTLNDTLTANSGQITDPTHPVFIINWRLAGKRVLAAEIFTAILDNVINCGPKPLQEDVPNIHGVSASGKVGISFVQRRPDPYVRTLTCGVLLRALDLIAADVLGTNHRFGEYSFELTWGGYKFAEGHVVELDEAAVGNGTVGAAVQK